MLSHRGDCVGVERDDPAPVALRGAFDAPTFHDCLRAGEGHFLVVERQVRPPKEEQLATGDALSRWLSTWIQEPAQADNLTKLARSGADQRHLFVLFPGFTIAPFSVVELLTRDDPPLPATAPDLPVEVTHLWAVSTWSIGRGMRWAPGAGWSPFDKLQRLAQDDEDETDKV